MLALVIAAVGISYQAPADCPDAEVFLSELTARTRDRQFVLGVGDPSFAIEIQDSAGGKVGRVRRDNVDREVSGVGVSCDELVRALALTTALSLEEVAKPPVEAPTPPPPVPVAGVKARAPWGVGVLAGASGALTEAMPVAALFVENRRAWELRLTVSHARNDVTGSPGDAAFALTLGQLDVCPLVFGAFRLCGSGQAGLLSARGISGANVDTPKSARLFVAAAGPSARARWQVTPRLNLEVDVAGRVSLRTQRFVLETMPEVVVARLPSLTWCAMAGASLTIP